MSNKTVVIPKRYYTSFSVESETGELSIEFCQASMAELLGEFIDKRELTLPVMEDSCVFSFRDSEYRLSSSGFRTLKAIVDQGGDTTALDIYQQVGVSEKSIPTYITRLQEELLDLNAPFSAERESGRIFIKI